MDVVKLLQEMIRVPSPSGREGELARYVRDALGGVGIDKAWIDGLGNVVASVKGGGLGSVVLEGHLDTVDVGDLGSWGVEPFSGVVVGGRVYGRGAADMKGSIAAQVASLEGLDPLDIDLYLVYTVHEETAEGVAFSYALNESLGGLRPGAVVIGEATSLNLGVGHRGRAVVRVEILGRSAHASMPSEGVNALYGLSELISRLKGVKLREHPVLGGETAVATVADCSPKVVPQIPDKCAAYVDYRVVLGTTEADVTNTLRGLCREVVKAGHALECEVRINEEVLKCWTGREVRAHEFFPPWLSVNEEVVGGCLKALSSVNPSVRTYVWRFSTDGVFSAGTAGYLTLGFGPADEVMAHKPNEYVEVKQLVRAVKGYRLLLRALETYTAKRR
ncbi:MAG: hypothetical protein B6U73_00425 [Desulfurococcales archaeon ex4484_204]|nr:MAG: hypothetical protein B6U73_00425 [Desulfurococcales archaeon ex4484_204]